MRARTLLDVFRMGTSFSVLILASRSSHARPVFWKRILGVVGWSQGDFHVQMASPCHTWVTGK